MVCHCVRCCTSHSKRAIPAQGSSSRLKGEGKREGYRSPEIIRKFVAKQKLLVTRSSFLPHNLLSEQAKHAHDFPCTHCRSEQGKMPSSRPCCATRKVSGPWSLPTKRTMWALPNLLQRRISQHCSSSWSRWYELIQLTFSWSRADCQQSCGRGNLWLEGCAKHLWVVMASTDTATCRLNICSQLFIKDNWYIGMVMCLAVCDTGLHLRHCSLKLGLPFLSFPFISPGFTVNFAVGEPPAGLKVEWHGVERGARGKNCTGALLTLFSLSLCGSHVCTWSHVLPAGVRPRAESASDGADSWSTVPREASCSGAGCSS